MACSTFAPPTNVLVTRVPPGDRAVQEEGDPLKISRWNVGLTREGLKKGYFVVKSDVQWRELWPTTEPDKVPLLPFDVDFGREMLLVSSPPSASTVSSEVKAVVLTDRTAHVYVSETALGADCPEGKETSAKNYDLVRTLRVDSKDVSYHVETIYGPPCGKPPEAEVRCKPDRSMGEMSEHLSVDPGAKVVCVASALKSSRPIFDLTWTWDALPNGSAAKIDVAKGSRGMTFTPDVIGLYRVQLEVSDDIARKGTVTAEVKVPPPDAPLALQLAWTKLDAIDDPAALPRAELHAYPLSADVVRAAKAAAGNKPGAVEKPPSVSWGNVKDCSNATPPPWCKTQVAGPTSVMTLDAAYAPEFAIGVHYTDERVPGQPPLCVRVYRDGKLVTERCDADKRDVDAYWTAGVIDSATGKTPDVLAQERAAALARAAAAADGGAPDGPARPTAEAGAPDAAAAHD